MFFQLWRLSTREARRKEWENDSEEAKSGTNSRGDGDGEDIVDSLKSVAIAYPSLKPHSLLKKAIKIRHFSRRKINAAVHEAGEEWRGRIGNLVFISIFS